MITIHVIIHINNTITIHTIQMLRKVVLERVRSSVRRTSAQNTMAVKQFDRASMTS